MQIGVIMLDGRQVGVVSWSSDNEPDAFIPNLDGYVPKGRAAEHGERQPRDAGGGHPRRQPSGVGVDADHGKVAHLLDRAHHHTSRRGEGYQPSGKTYSGEGGRGVRRGSVETDQAIVDAAKAHHLDPNTMRAVASIESGMNPNSNADRRTQYKGLFQIGSRGPDSEWARFGAGGNIYSARDNAMAAARMFSANRERFRSKYGRDPTDTELYMMHQQGLGFYTHGAMTNIAGNPYPGMHGAQSHETFEEGWGRELARRKAAFESGQTGPGPAPAGGNGRMTGDVDPRVDPRIPEIVGAAASHLPPGYTVSMSSGYRGAGQVNHNGRAADFRITDPDGNVLRNRGEDPDGMYQTLARHAYGEMLARHPDLKGQFAWGGAFGTQLGGGGERDLMHFDINGERGRYSDYQLRNMGPVPGVKYGPQPANVAEDKPRDVTFDPGTMAP